SLGLVLALFYSGQIYSGGNMDNNYQELIARLSNQQTMLLTTLLSSDNQETWNEHKHTIISHTPLLTLEMAVNRVCQREHNTPPTPAQIYAALEYAKRKNQQFSKIKSSTAIAS
ncbi:MAG: hypothetical protein R3240_05335, partial [Gammaproteobacteria bacterium]|nr:hypothetical protein [Gammaproteobacteria bacterium]